MEKNENMEKEKKLVEQELSQLVAFTLSLEDELNSLVVQKHN
jgi:hypothetical protein